MSQRVRNLVGGEVPGVGAGGQAPLGDVRGERQDGFSAWGEMREDE